MGHLACSVFIQKILKVLRFVAHTLFAKPLYVNKFMSLHRVVLFIKNVLNYNKQEMRDKFKPIAHLLLHCGRGIRNTCFYFQICKIFCCQFALHIVQTGFLGFSFSNSRKKKRQKAFAIVPFSFSRRCLNVFLVDWPRKLKSLSLLMVPF